MAIQVAHPWAAFLAFFEIDDWRCSYGLTDGSTVKYGVRVSFFIDSSRCAEAIDPHSVFSALDVVAIQQSLWAWHAFQANTALGRLEKRTWEYMFCIVTLDSCDVMW